MSLESDIKNQYEQFNNQNDWSTFKYAADYYLDNAAILLKEDIRHKDKNFKLLFRNIQKRLYIGIACELLLKAIYLKNGYVINKRKDPKKTQGKYPFLFSEINTDDFSKNDTLTFNHLLQKLSEVIPVEKEIKNKISKGLKIAKVFRNKEGHIVSLSHKYVPQNYRDIEQSLKLLYKLVFNEQLSIFITFANNEKGVFKIKKLTST